MKCEQCKGTGKIDGLDSTGFFKMPAQCESCRGRGRIYTSKVARVILDIAEQFEAKIKIELELATMEGLEPGIGRRFEQVKAFRDARHMVLERLAVCD